MFSDNFNNYSTAVAKFNMSSKILWFFKEILYSKQHEVKCRYLRGTDFLKMIKFLVEISPRTMNVLKKLILNRNVFIY